MSGRISRHAAVASVVLALATVGGCGDDDDGDGDAGTPSNGAPEPAEFTEALCDLLSEEDLAIVGPLFSSQVDVGDDPDLPRVHCTFTMSDPVVSVQLFFDGGVFGEPEAFERLLEDDENFEAVDGLEAPAARNPETGTLILWTDNEVRMTFIGSELDDRDAVLEALASAVLERIEGGSGG